MATFAPAGAPYPDYAAGVAYSEIGLVLLSLTPVHPSTEQDLGEVFRHELAHVALYDAVNSQAVPRWFNEGFAMVASGESSFLRMKTMLFANVGGSLIPIHDIERSFPDDELKAQVAYAEAVDVVRFLGAPRGRASVSRARSNSGCALVRPSTRRCSTPTASSLRRSSSSGATTSRAATLFGRFC